MSLKTKVKRLLIEKNPLTVARVKKLRNQVKNTSMTFLCPNCLGGILFHDLGLQFRSPTVNLMMTQTDFLKFVQDLDHYLAQPFVFYSHPEYTCPCAKLDDINVHFTHYHSAQEAEQKWKERVSRIDKNNLFVFIQERDGLTKEHIQSLKALKARGVVAFTANRYDDIPYALHIPKYEPDGEVGNTLRQSYLDGSREYEKYFDFVKWFNQADGGDFAIDAFRK